MSWLLIRRSSSAIALSTSALSTRSTLPGSTVMWISVLSAWESFDLIASPVRSPACAAWEKSTFARRESRADCSWTTLSGAAL